MRALRYRIGLFGKIILQVFDPAYRGADIGEWRDARLQDISWGEHDPINPIAPTSPASSSDSRPR